MSLLRPRVDGVEGDAPTRQMSPPQSKFSGGQTNTDTTSIPGPEQRHGIDSMNTICLDSHRGEAKEKMCPSPIGSTSEGRMDTAMYARNPGPTCREAFVMGSREYKERRNKRAARGMATLRQLGQEFGRINTL